MGSDSSKFEVVPVPQNPPVVAVDPRFCFPHQISLLMKEKSFSFSGDDFTIQDQQGTVYFKIDGKAFSFRDKKVLPVVTMNNKFLEFIGRKFKITRGDTSQEMFVIKAHRRKVSVEFTNLLTNTQQSVVLKFSWYSRKGAFFLGHENGVPLGRIYQTNVFSADEYILEVAPGVDLCLIVLLTLAYDELKEGENSK
jgi:uncharacterized protein YxjI